MHRTFESNEPPRLRRHVMGLVIEREVLSVGPTPLLENFCCGQGLWREAHVYRRAQQLSLRGLTSGRFICCCGSAVGCGRGHTRIGAVQRTSIPHQEISFLQRGDDPLQQPQQFSSSARCMYTTLSLEHIYREGPVVCKTHCRASIGTGRLVSVQLRKPHVAAIDDCEAATFL